MGIQLRTATKDDIPGIVRLSLVAFDPSDDVISRRLFPAQLQPPNQTPTAGLSQWISTRKTARLSMENATVLVATDDSVGNNDEVVGYAVWFLPIQDANGDDVSPDFPPPPRLSFEGGDMEAFKTLRGIMMDDERKEFGEEGAKSVLSLDSLGVQPSYRRRGIGMMLLEWGTRQASDQGRDCYLVSTPIGLPLYRAAGFATTRIMDVFGDTYHSMRRSA